MKCPWYWQLKAIISERPNQVPAGIGNNASNYDVSLLLGSAHTSELGDTSSDGIVGLDDMHVDDGDDDGDDDTGRSKEIGDETDGNEGSEEEVQIVTEGGAKRKVVVLEEAKPVVTAKKTAPQKGKSTPATVSQTASKKSKTGATERMNAVSVKEEETTQKLLELKKTKVRAETEKQVAKVRAKADVKMQADKLKADIAVRKMELEYKLKMAQLGHVDHAGQSASFSGNVPVASSSTSGWSGAGSTTPSSHLDGELQEPSSSFIDPYNFDFSYDINNATNN
jgi:hypothetical protein